MTCAWVGPDSRSRYRCGRFPCLASLPTPVLRLTSFWRRVNRYAAGCAGFARNAMSSSRSSASAIRCNVAICMLAPRDSSNDTCCRVTPTRSASAPCETPARWRAHRIWSRTANDGSTATSSTRALRFGLKRGTGGASPSSRCSSSHPSRASRATSAIDSPPVAKVWHPGQSGNSINVLRPSFAIVAT